MHSTRKEFLFGVGATVFSSKLLGRDAGDKVLLRVGITTDTHFGRPDVKGVERVEKAWNLFKAKGCQVIANCGDIADKCYAKWYAEVCALRERVFTDPKTAPREVWVYAGHDRIDMPNDTDKKGLGNYAFLKDALKIPHEAYDSFSMAGFEFVVVPSCVDYKRFETLLTAACKRTPGKPVFVFDHHPGTNTTANTVRWGYDHRRTFLSKFPQVVHITGHVHGSLWDELNIHQDTYTTVNAACLTYFSESFVGAPHAETGQNRSVLILELSADQAVFRRYLIDNGQEIGAEEPWTLTWPYDPKHPFYTRENMRARHTPPEFKAGAALAVEVKDTASRQSPGKCPKLVVRIPETGNRFTRHYRVEAFHMVDGKRVRILQHDIRGEFWRDPAKRSPWVQAVLDAGFFTADEDLEITATPCDFWGNEGRALVWRGKAPADTYRLVWSGDWSADKYQLPPLPSEANGKDVKIVVDAEFDNSELSGVDFGVKACDFWWVGTISTPPGHSKLTYVFYITKANVSKRYEFAFRGGIKGWTVKFSNLRILI